LDSLEYKPNPRANHIGPKTSVTPQLPRFASTNLVLELGIILWVLMGWQFTLAEFIGGPVMIVLLVLLLRRAMTPALLAQARAQAERGIAGRMEGHAAMDMSLSGGSILTRALSQRGFTAISHFYVMDWASIWIEIVGGLLIAGALAAWVPYAFWTSLFLSQDPVWSKVVGPLIGPMVAVISFVCSVGNVPLAAVLWSGGISFGGVVAFLFADLIVLPILNIYRKYYGLRVAMLLFVLFYAAMAGAGYVVELVFGVLGLVPGERRMQILQLGVSWNYTTVLNIVALAVSAVLVWRFLRTGGPDMLRMMGSEGQSARDGNHAHHH
jgi:uncharacterized membrane protein YraQ (UPF0718 family)